MICNDFRKTTDSRMQLRESCRPDASETFGMERLTNLTLFWSGGFQIDTH